MEFTRRARQVKAKGKLKGSLHIYIPPEIVDAFKIKKDDLVTLELIKVTKV